MAEKSITPPPHEEVNISYQVMKVTNEVFEIKKIIFEKEELPVFTPSLPTVPSTPVVRRRRIKRR